MTADEQARLDALTTENNTLKESIRALQTQNEVVLATATVTGILKESGVTIPTSLVSRVCSSPVVKEGKVDLEWAKAVAAELAEAAGGQGRVTGLGVVGTHATEAQKKDSDKAFTESLKKLGVPEAGLAVASY